MTTIGLAACEHGAVFMAQAFKNSDELMSQSKGREVRIRCIQQVEKPR